MSSEACSSPGRARPARGGTTARAMAATRQLHRPVQYRTARRCMRRRTAPAPLCRRASRACPLLPVSSSGTRTRAPREHGLRKSSYTVARQTSGSPLVFRRRGARTPVPRRRQLPRHRGAGRAGAAAAAWEHVRALRGVGAGGQVPQPGPVPPGRVRDRVPRVRRAHARGGAAGPVPHWRLGRGAEQLVSAGALPVPRRHQRRGQLLPHRQLLHPVPRRNAHDRRGRRLPRPAPGAPSRTTTRAREREMQTQLCWLQPVWLPLPAKSPTASLGH